jgi:predicted DNA-binding protein
MKTKILTLRITNVLKNRLELSANDYAVTTSSLIRDILEQHFEAEKIDFQQIKNDLDRVEFVSADFIQLTAWIYQIRFDNSATISTRYADQLKNILFKIFRSDDYPEDLKKEFEKIHHELSKFSFASTITFQQFSFGYPNHSLSFNYNILQEFILSKGFTTAVIWHEKL